MLNVVLDSYLTNEKSYHSNVIKISAERIARMQNETYLPSNTQRNLWYINSLRTVEDASSPVARATIERAIYTHT